jgi:methyl coenzyme M reductase alpha subunit
MTFFKYFKLALDVIAEDVRRRKALRIMNKQEWSVEFLEKLLIRASKSYSKGIELELVSPLGQRLIIRSTDAAVKKLAEEDDILLHLDNEVKVQQFIDKIQGAAL